MNKAQLIEVARKWTGTRTVRAAILALLVWILNIVTEDYVTKAVLPPVWDFAKSLSTKPAGPFLTAAVALFALTLASSIIGSLTAARRGMIAGNGTRRRPLTPDERNSVEAARMLWSSDATVACDRAIYLLNHVAEHAGESGNPFGSLLRFPISTLADSLKRLQQQLADKDTSVEQMQDALNGVRSGYWTGVAYLRRYIFVVPAFLDGPSRKTAFAELQQAHAALADAYIRLSRHSAYERRVAPVPVDLEDLGFEHDLFFRENVRRSRARVIYDRTLLMTDDERGFLALFTEAEPVVRSHDHRETWLSAAVYRAGQLLAADGVINSREVRSGRVRFCLNESTLFLLRDRAERVMRECVDVDLDTVAASGASGSGA